ncbi:MAG: ATP-binding protein [Deltaproteobacteria bacterium]|nr:ATP-binding protein [Deltaproteobacteria bacterium]
MTGGPSAGKTTVIEIIRREFSSVSSTIPEAASILYQGGFPREMQGVPRSEITKCAQRAIYFTQIQMERLFEAIPGKQLIFCDRGTLDHPAYWPESAENFFQDVKTDLQTEVSRYDFVIHLETATKEHGYDASSLIRRENHNEAVTVDKRILDSWKDHPRRVIIPSSLSFHEKISTVFQTVEILLKGHPEFQQPAKNLRSKFMETSSWAAAV